MAYRFFGEQINSAGGNGFLNGIHSCIHFRQIDGLVEDCSNSIVNALELRQSYTKPSKYV